MLRCITLRLALPVVLSATLLPAAAFAQSQDSQSVAEAARRAREQKKAQTKPAKVITEDDVKPAAQSTPATPASPDATAASRTPAPPAAPTADAVSAPPGGSSPAPDAKDQKNAKELAELKSKIKEAGSDLDLLQREQSLENESHYSSADYVHDTAGKAKLDALKQQISDKQQELERLKAQLAALPASQESPTTTPPKS